MIDPIAKEAKLVSSKIKVLEKMLETSEKIDGGDNDERLLELHANLKKMSETIDKSIEELKK